MKLGILTDIHEHVDHLRTALSHFQAEQVDQIVFIGDVCQTGRRLRETIALLEAADVVGVWGNHDFGLREPTDSLLNKYGDDVVSYIQRLHPGLELDGCWFSHVEPFLDAEKLVDLWYLGGAPQTAAEAARSFHAVPHRYIFVGHYHRWLATTPQRMLDWNGDRPIQLDPQQRHLVVVGALIFGQYAFFDTDTGLLTPCQVTG